MKQSQYLWMIIKTVITVCVLFMLAAIMYQTNNYEKRVINLESKIEKMLTGRILSSQIVIPSETPQNTTSTEEKQKKYLHPELADITVGGNFFELSPDANFDNELFVAADSEEKGYNVLVENSSYVRSRYANYVMCNFARRKWNDANTWVRELAERVELVDDKDFIIYLKPGVKWHAPAVDFMNPRYEWLKGDHYVTAHDVKFTYDMIMNTQAEVGPTRQMFEKLKNVEVIDDYTVKFEWIEPLYISKANTFEEFNILPEFLYAYDEDGTRFPDETLGLKFNSHWYNDRMIGCGPYRFAEHVSGVKVVFERNEDYNLNPKPPSKRVTYMITPDMQSQYLKLQSGEVDLIELLEETVYREDIIGENQDSPFKKGELNYQTYPRTVYYYIAWNAAKPIFKSKLVRQAMTHAFDREGILKNVLMNLGGVTTVDIMPWQPEYDSSITPYPFDLAKAAELLAQDGWKDTDGNGILDKVIDGEKKPFEFDMLFLSTIP
ncbi:MAG: ABC transporter substrate-binding protein, partial [Pseudomonadota bacterium]